MNEILGFLFILFVLDIIWEWILEPICAWIGYRTADLIEFIVKRSNKDGNNGV